MENQHCNTDKKVTFVGLPNTQPKFYVKKWLELCIGNPTLKQPTINEAPEGASLIVGWHPQRESMRF